MNDYIKFNQEILKINLKGEIDHHISSVIKNEIDTCITNYRAKKLLFDFKNVTFMDSSGIGMIIGRYKKIKKLGGKIGVVNLSPKIKRIFEMSGLFNIIYYFSSEKDVVDNF